MKTLHRLLRPHPVWLVPSALWIGVIWLLSARPASAYRKVGPVEAKRLPVGQLAVAAHLVAYGTLGAVLSLGVPRHGRLSRSILAWTITVLYGVIDERHQARVPGRDASILDIVTDGFGALGGIASTWAIQSIREHERN
jgi:hypothetical protein